jgi:hypothetical protein
VALVGPSSCGFRGVIGVAGRDITPPIGIHARNWGASTHDVAEGVHRPLTLTALTIEPSDGVGPPLVLISADLMSWRSRAAEAAVIARVLEETGTAREHLMFCLTHTHAAPSVRSEDAEKPGGALIEPYQQQIVRAAIEAVREAQARKVPATLAWRYGRCDLAANRDLPDPAGGRRIVCGCNPTAAADDTLLVGRVAADRSGRPVATIVNYGCHATTLAWQNRLISPDFVGAMRELVESHAGGAPCLFLQGASGELAPAQQYTDDVAVADRHGRRLGHAVVSTLEAFETPGTRLTYEAVVESGAPLAVWREQPHAASTALASATRGVELPLKPMPALAELEAARQAARDPVTRERLARQAAVRTIVGDGATTRTPLSAWRVGDAVLIGQPNEAYSHLQVQLRRGFAGRTIAVMNLVNGSVGYLPPREMYAHDVYQVSQSPYAAGALEALTAAAEQLVEELLA